jgi:hypothetical protein
MRPVGSTAKLLDMLLSNPVVVMAYTGTACVLLSHKYLLILCTACMHVAVMLGYLQENPGWLYDCRLRLLTL